MGENRGVERRSVEKTIGGEGFSMMERRSVCG